MNMFELHQRLTVVGGMRVDRSNARTAANVDWTVFSRSNPPKMLYWFKVVLNPFGCE
jgi:hypothetical protein